MIFLVDCNNFYVSCERLFRPDLNYTPVVVLSNNDGCIISRSNEAKKLGIPESKDELWKSKNEILIKEIKILASSTSLKI